MAPVCLSPNGRNVLHQSEPVTRLLVGTIDGVAIVERAGESAPWHAAGHQLAGKHVSSLLWEPKSGSLFAGIHGHGLYFSADGGDSWELRTSGMDVDHVYCLASVEQDGKVAIYAGTEPAHLYRSFDLGRSWEELASLRQVPGVEKWNFPAPPHIGHVKSIAFDPRDVRVMYAGIEQGALLKSLDGGQTWRELTGWWREDEKNYKDVHRCLLRASNPDEVYFSGGEGLNYSPDAGGTWEHLTDNTFRIGYPDQLVFSPFDDRTLFMAGSSHDPSFWRDSHQARSTVVRSRDCGRTWEPCSTGLPDPMRPNLEAMSVVIRDGAYTLFIADTDGDVYCSDDEGGHWSALASRLGPVSKMNHYERLQATAA
ncbi:MAG TPA: glycosyl hydrolase [Chloroflexota bacterium]|nr:glycosyl hydrolase [Chloroflexota bacterium]